MSGMVWRGINRGHQNALQSLLDHALGDHWPAATYLDQGSIASTGGVGALDC